MSSGAPPHPGAAWRQLADRESGFPYYWNTATNQVRWDVPVELVQYRQSLAPPPLPTNPPLSNDPPPSVSGSGQPGNAPHPAIGPQMPPNLASAGITQRNTSIGPQQPLMPSNTLHTAGAKTSLIAYDDSDSETDEKVAEQEPSKVSDIKEVEGTTEHTTEDILALLEAEKPPDYVGPENTKQPSFSTASSMGIPSNGASTTLNGNQYPANQHTSGPPPSHQFALPPPSMATSQPPLPVRRPQLGSMLQLACNYGHESGSDEEEDEEVGKKKPKKIMDGQLDSAGRMFFTETREQREAKERQKEKQRREEEEKRDEAAKSGAGGVRKKRLALPGGRPRFNKADLVTEQHAEEQEREIEERMLRYMEYQRQQSPPVDPSREESDVTNGVKKKQLTDTEAASEEAAELVEKLEYFKVAEEKVSTLKTLAIKLETLYTAWSAGALSLSYLTATLASSKLLLEEAELTLVEAPWKPTWDRALKTYTFSNSLTGEHHGPEPEPKATPPPLPPPDELERPPLPPAPAGPAPAPPPSAPEDSECPAPDSVPPAPTTLQLVAGYGDMEIEEEQEEPPADSMTDEMANFYSSLEPEEEQVEATETGDNASSQAPTWAGKEALRPSPASDPSTATMSPSSSTPSSPLPVEPKTKKRKKVKVSNNIALKKKGVGDMLLKWQNINN